MASLNRLTGRVLLSPQFPPILEAALLRPPRSSGRFVIPRRLLHSDNNKPTRTSATTSSAIPDADGASSPAKTKAKKSPGKHWLHYDQASHTAGVNNHHSPASATLQDSLRERNRTVTSYYNQTAIDLAAANSSVRLTPATILYSGNDSSPQNIMRSARYIRKELPIRIAHRITGIRSLPFIVGCNPTILAVHELYIRAFHILNDFPALKTAEDEEKFSKVLGQLLEDHKDVVSQLAQGFKECRKHIKDEDLIRNYLDRNLTSRLGIRIMATHHLLLKERKEGYIGCINVRMNLRSVIQRWATFVQRIAEDRYGYAPAIRISGHVDAEFPYMEMPLDYILPELLKNAVRATVEFYPGAKDSGLPPVYVTIANNNEDFIVKISDRGGGIPHDELEKAMQYNFSTAEDSTAQLMNNDIFGNMMEEVNRTTSGPMHGYGFGLPTSRAYAEYLGGSLDVQSMQGLGTDVYLRLGHINSKGKPIRI